MTASCLFKEIKHLNKDIDNCMSRLDSNSEKKLICPPNCYCDKRTAVDQRNYGTITRKKTATATVTKSDITPRYYLEGDRPPEFIANIKQDTCIVDNDCFENLCCEKLKNDYVDKTSLKFSKGDILAEPVKLPKKSSRVRKEASWSSILQQNQVNVKENIDCNFIPRRQKNIYTQKNTSSSSSAVSSAAVETQSVFVKSKGVQCEDKRFRKDKYVQYDDPVNTIQCLIMNMKHKLKDDPSVGSMLDEMEVVLQKIPFDRGDCQAAESLSGDRKSGVYDKYLQSRHNFFLKKRQTSYEDVINLETTYLELEATCAKLKKERDIAVDKASQKSVELVESMRREVETKVKLTETNTKIKEMSKKLETYTKSMQGLTEHVKRLQHENKDLEKIREQVSQLSSMMRDVTMENKSLVTELQLVTIERNKLEVALAIKEQEIAKKNKELENMSQLLMHRSNHEREYLEKREEKLKSLNKKTRPKSKNNTKAPEQPHPNQSQHSTPHLIASSPNTSTESPLHEDLQSWFAFSTILSSDENTKSEHPKEEINNCKPEGQTNLPYQPKERLPQPVGVQTLSASNISEKRPDINKIEKLKDEIRRMFTEMRELAKDVPSVPVVEFRSLVEENSDLNWSEVSITANSYDSLSDFHSSDVEEFFKKNQMKQ